MAARLLSEFACRHDIPPVIDIILLVFEVGMDTDRRADTPADC